MMMRLWLVPLFAVMAACLPARGEAAKAECGLNALMQLAIENYGESAWFSLGRFRRLEDTCNSESDLAWYQSARSQVESMIGNHAAALSYMDAYRGFDFSRDSVQDFPSSITSVLAAEYVIEKARDRRIVMVNERHQASSDRLLTLELLAPLAEQGFRYLAVEAVANGDPINTRGYPIPQTGYYVNDVVFAEVLRSAIELGYQIIGYEIEGEQRNSAEPAIDANSRERREWWQAKNIATRVFDIDNDAKLLVHAGYGHVWEYGTDTWSPMAVHLREFTGLDPLTVDQTDLSERSSPEFEHPLRTRAKERGLLDEDAVVLIDAEGEPIRTDEGVDIFVFGVTTDYADGRPIWMDMGGRRHPTVFDTPECAEQTCIVEARRAGFPDELPLDRVEIAGAGRTTLYLPAGKDIVVHVMELDQSVLAIRNVRVPEFQNIYFLCRLLQINCVSPKQ